METEPGQRLGVLDPHGLQAVRIQPERLQDGRRDLRRLDRGAGSASSMMTFVSSRAKPPCSITFFLPV